MSLIYGVELKNKDNLTIKKTQLINELILGEIPLVYDVLLIIKKYLYDVSEYIIGSFKFEKDRDEKYYGIQNYIYDDGDKTSYKSITPLKLGMSKSYINNISKILENPSLMSTISMKRNTYIMYGVIVNEFADDIDYDVQDHDEVKQIVEAFNGAALTYLDDQFYCYCGFIVEKIESDDEFSMDKLTKKYKVEDYHDMINLLEKILKVGNLTAKSLPMVIMFNNYY
jgi:hypothetical protein